MSKFDLGVLNSGLNWFDITILFVVGIPIALITILILEAKRHE